MMLTEHLVMIVAGFVIGAAMGGFMHRSDYCMASMFRDLFLFRTTAMLKNFLLFLAVSMPLFELLRLSGLVMFPFPKYGPPTITNLIGGFLFGAGMVLAGGCAVGTLYKMASGSFPSLLAFVGMILGSILFAFFYPKWSLLAPSLNLPTTAITLPDLLHIPPWLTISVFLLVAIPVLFSWFRKGSLQRPVVVEGYLQPWKASVGIALLAVLFLLLIGLPMGVTTTNAKLGAMLLNLLAPEKYESVVYFHKNSFEYFSLLFGVQVVGGPGTAFDGVALVQYPLIAGILSGAAGSAILLGEWHLRFKLPWRQVFSALAGGIVMGFASRIAPSCNLWHLFGGLPALGLQSILFLVGMVSGSWIGSILLSRFLIPETQAGGV